MANAANSTEPAVLGVAVGALLASAEAALVSVVATHY
jgi:hypothetical protein